MFSDFFLLIMHFLRVIQALFAEEMVKQKYEYVLLYVTLKILFVKK